MTEKKEKLPKTALELLVGVPIYGGPTGGNSLRRKNFISVPNLPPEGGYKSNESQDVPQTNGQ